MTLEADKRILLAKSYRNWALAWSFILLINLLDLFLACALGALVHPLFYLLVLVHLWAHLRLADDVIDNLLKRRRLLHGEPERML